MGLKVYVLINNQIYKLMKKLFTLIALALSVNGAFAQTESYQPFADGALKAEYTSAVAGADGDLVVSLQATPSVALTVRSSRTPTDSSTPNLNNTNWDSWSDPSFSYDNGPGDLQDGATFPTLRGTGVAYISFVGYEKTKDGEPLGIYNPGAQNSNGENGWVYYDPTAPSIPASGLYYKLTPSAKGTIKAGFWINKNNRLFYVASESGGTVANVEYTVEGYVNGQNITVDNGDGTTSNKKKYLSAEEMKEISPTPYLVGGGNQASWVYVIFPVEPGVNYYCFNHNAQAGFRGFEFTPDGSASIEDVNTFKQDDPNAPVFNLAGQQVSNGFRGIVVKNGKKFIK